MFIGEQEVIIERSIFTAVLQGIMFQRGQLGMTSWA